MDVLHQFVIITAIFTTCLIIANIITVKPISFYRLPAAIVIFPLSYIYGLLFGKEGNLVELKEGV